MPFGIPAVEAQHGSPQQALDRVGQDQVILAHLVDGAEADRLDASGADDRVDDLAAEDAERASRRAIARAT